MVGLPKTQTFTTREISATGSLLSATLPPTFSSRLRIRLKHPLVGAINGNC